MINRIGVICESGLAYVVPTHVSAIIPTEHGCVLHLIGGTTVTTAMDAHTTCDLLEGKCLKGAITSPCQQRKAARDAQLCNFINSRTEWPSLREIGRMFNISSACAYHTIRKGLSDGVITVPYCTVTKARSIKFQKLVDDAKAHPEISINALAIQHGYTPSSGTRARIRAAGVHRLNRPRLDWPAVVAYAEEHPELSLSQIAETYAAPLSCIVPGFRNRRIRRHVFAGIPSPSVYELEQEYRAYLFARQNQRKQRYIDKKLTEEALQTVALADRINNSELSPKGD